MAITSGNEYVTYSTRYQRFVILDGSGRQVFSNSGHPLTYDNRDNAAIALNFLRSGRI